MGRHRKQAAVLQQWLHSVFRHGHPFPEGKDRDRSGLAPLLQF
jgi:hypothetical protein